MQFLAILGRQPELSLAELEAIVGPGKLRQAGRYGALLNEELDIERLGGTVKLARLIGELQPGDWRKEFLQAARKEISDNHKGKGKINLGLSVYGGRVSAGEVQKTIYGLKKELKPDGFSLRTVPNRASELNAAQVIHNKLLGGKGIEFVVILDGKRVFLAATTAVQDIDEYSRRDREKPVRDPTAGMLPPKLAQILINLAAPKAGATVLDPFCGTGTLLMEAQMMGLDAYGSDLAPKMVGATRQNLEWLATVKSPGNVMVEEADARSHEWSKFDCVATETYLGPPLRELPDKPALEGIIAKVDDLHREFLHNISAQMKKGQRLVAAVPAWQSRSHRLIRLPMLDDLEKLGYNRIRFEHVNEELVYRRPDQVVAREILVLIRK